MDQRGGNVGVEVLLTDNLEEMEVVVFVLAFKILGIPFTTKRVSQVKFITAVVIIGTLQADVIISTQTKLNYWWR